MTKIDMAMYGALIGQALGVLGMLVGTGVMLRLRAKERREHNGQRARGQRP
jgi:hypothetical protein